MNHKKKIKLEWILLTALLIMLYLGVVIVILMVMQLKIVVLIHLFLKIVVEHVRIVVEIETAGAVTLITVVVLNNPFKIINYCKSNPSTSEEK